jgi:hypothetical protein
MMTVELLEVVDRGGSCEEEEVVVPVVVEGRVG